jgi:hypothetical protein
MTDESTNVKEVIVLWSQNVLKNVENNYQETRETRRELSQIHADIRKEIGQLHAELSRLELSLATFKTEMQIKSVVWGFAAGAIPVVLTILYQVFAKK